MAPLLAHRGDRMPPTTDGFDALVVLVGAMGANDDDRHAWIRPTKELIGEAAREHLPTLGVCLGHQLAAVALGGRVETNPCGPAAGPTPVALTAAGRDDELLSAVADGDRAIQWNNDVVTEPPVGQSFWRPRPTDHHKH